MRDAMLHDFRPTSERGEMRSTETLGFIGLGVMGEPMCANLIAKSKKPVHGADLQRGPLERLAARGLKACGSIAEVAAAAPYDGEARGS